MMKLKYWRPRNVTPSPQPHRTEVRTNATQRVKKLFLRLPDLECEQAKKAKNLVDIFEGSTAVVLYNSQTKEYVNYENKTEVSDFLIKELKSVLGEENVVYG